MSNHELRTEQMKQVPPVYDARYDRTASKVKPKFNWKAAGLTVLCFLVGVALGRASAPAQPRPAYVPPATSSSALATPPPSPPPVPAGPASSFTNGTYLVGRDVVAGTYVSPGPEEGIVVLCSATVSEDGTYVDISTSREGQSRLTLEDGQEVASHGCLDWTLQQ